MSAAERRAVREAATGLAILGIVVFSMMAFASTAWAVETDAPVDSLDWPGQPAVEASVRAQLAELWRVTPSELEIEFGQVRSDWIPGAGLEVSLRGTGRGGYFVVAAEDATGRISVRIRAGRSVLRTVSARALPRGHLITEDDLAPARTTAWGTDAAGQPDDMIGWEVKRAVSAGEVLTEPTVAPPAAVISGSPVQIEFRAGAVSITMGGTALGTGPVGAELFVRTQNGERLRGSVTASGRVLVLSNRNDR